MRKVLLSIILMVFLMSCSGSKTYTVTGKIEGASEGTVVLLKINAEGRAVPADTAEIKDEVFKFTGSVESPQMAVIQIEAKRPFQFFLENSKISIETQIDSLNKAEISGSAAQDRYNEFNNNLKEFEDQINDLYQKYMQAQQNGEKEKLAIIREKYSDVNEKMMEATKKSALNEYADNVLGPFLIHTRLSHSMKLDELKSSFTRLSSKLSHNIYYQLIEKRISTLESVAVGKTAPDFEMKNPDGEIIKLSSLRGKYLLIDFWASWCRPCREENPNVVKIYKKFKDKGFDILGVSLDITKEKWLQAIKDDKISWHHVSELKGWDDRVAGLYGVRSIPHTVLLDKEGKIITKNLRGEELRNKIEELIKLSL